MAIFRLTYPRIVVEGHDISDAVRSYEVRQSVGDMPTMTVELVLPDAASIVEDPAIAQGAKVILGRETQEALVALGWTPPE
jgi:hypothetical protein